MKYAIAAILIIALLMAYLAGSDAEVECFIICNPKSHVWVRRSPKKGAEEIGFLDCGDRFLTDGKRKNGFVHVVGITEYGEGWIHKGYVVYDKPEIVNCRGTVAATGRVKLQRYIGGKRIGYINVCEDVKVFAISEDWAVTNRGFIKLKYLELWNE